MNELIPVKQAYQLNKRRMAWTALGMMIVSTIAVLIDPARMAEPDNVHVRCYRANILRTEYLANVLEFSLVCFLIAEFNRQEISERHACKCDHG
jgi:hypothetical protein